jgi:hypothetical protein
MDGVPWDPDYAERRGTPFLGLLLALAVLGVAAAAASMSVTDGPTDCGTALSQRPGTSGAARIEAGQTATSIGKTGCDKAISDRRLQIAVGVTVALGVVLYVSVSSSGSRGVD